MPPEWRALMEELGPVFARRSTHRLFMALGVRADPGGPGGTGDGDGRGGGDRAGNGGGPCWFFRRRFLGPGRARAWQVARLIVKLPAQRGAEPLTVAVGRDVSSAGGGRKVHEGPVGL